MQGFVALGPPDLGAVVISDALFDRGVTGHAFVEPDAVGPHTFQLLAHGRARFEGEGAVGDFVRQAVAG